MLYALQGCAHPLHPSERGKEKERERERERKLFLFLKGMMGALAPFSYLVIYRIGPRHTSDEKLVKFNQRQLGNSDIDFLSFAIAFVL